MGFGNFVEKVKMQPLKESEKEYFHDYINATRDITNSEIIKPFIFEVLGKTYLTSIDPEGTTVLMITEDSIGIATRAVLYKNGNIDAVNIQDWNYGFTSNPTKTIQRVDCFEIVHEVFAFVEINDKKYYQYIQNSKIQDELAFFRYDASVNNPDVFINFINSKSPESIYLQNKKKLINSIKAYFLDNGKYYEAHKIPFRDKYVPSLANYYSIEALMTYLQKKEFNTTVPEELISMFKGSNDDLNSAITIAETYRSLALKK